MLVLVCRCGGACGFVGNAVALSIKSTGTVYGAVGRPFSEIIAYVRAQGIDLIVMATHGRGAIAQMLLGSTTEKVVRKAQCAVLTIRPDEHKFVMP